MVYFLTKASSDIIKIAAKSNTLQRVCTMSTQTPKELRIPVPWGHIAAKEWGPSDGSICVLGLHGWQDNASTFDGLAPLLPADIRFVAIDLQGHGQSSHLAPGAFYHRVEYLLTIRRVVDYLGWSQFAIIGHSMGAGLAVFFTAMFPDRVSKVVCFDGLIPLPTKPEAQPGITMFGIEQVIRMETKKHENHSYTFDEAVKRYVSALEGNIQESSARTLLERGTVKVDGDRVRFSRDKRLGIKYLLGFTADQATAFVRAFKKEILVIKVKGGILEYPLIDELLAILKTGAAKLVFREVEGKHHVHLDNPSLIAPFVCDFLDSKLV